MKNWFLQKNDAEQKIIVVLAIFTLVVLLYTFLYLPLKRANTQLKSSIDDIRTEIATMHSLEPQLARFNNNSNIKKVPMDDSQMMALIENIAKQQQITLTNIKSQSKNKISITLNSVDFNTAIRWLDILQTQYHISIAQLSVEAEKKGSTNIVVIISH